MTGRFSPPGGLAGLLGGATCLAASFGAGGPAPAQPAEPPRAAPTCAIDEQASGAAVVLRGLASAETRLQGTYTLHVRKSGTGGTSDISQAGAFTLEPGVRASLGQVGLSLEADGRYEAVLTLTVGGAMLECRASGPQISRL